MKNPFKKEKTFMELEAEKLEQRIAAEEYESVEWLKDMAVLRTLYDDIAKAKKKEPKDLKWLGQAIGGLATASAMVAVGLIAAKTNRRGQDMAKETAELAYKKDAELELKNGNVWKEKDSFKTDWQK